MVGAILTQNTSWANVEKAIDALKNAQALSVRAIARMPRRHLERLIRPSGYFRQKAKRLQLFAREMEKHPFLARKSGSLKDLRTRLLSLHGIGPETADSMLLYAGGYPVFVVDAYTRRIGQRIGLFQHDAYEQIRSYFEGHLPRKVRLYNEFHALLVRLAKEVCTKRRPKCQLCPVRLTCRYGREGLLR